jgi:hypothetical protein
MQQTSALRRVGVFEFAPPGDPANDEEALKERVAIMCVENDWDEATALQEARWQADRERCWRVFLANAHRVLEVPRDRWEGLLMRFEVEAASRYGKATARDMAASLRSWIVARGVQ